jgi:hypothetical protein
VIWGSSVSVGVPVSAITYAVGGVENEEVGEVGYEADEAEEARDKVEAAVRGWNAWFASTEMGTKAQTKIIFNRIVMTAYVKEWMDAGPGGRAMGS